MVYMVQQLVLAWLQSAMAFLVGGVCFYAVKLADDPSVTGWSDVLSCSSPTHTVLHAGAQQLSGIGLVDIDFMCMFLCCISSHFHDALMLLCLSDC